MRLIAILLAALTFTAPIQPSICITSAPKNNRKLLDSTVRRPRIFLYPPNVTKPFDLLDEEAQRLRGGVPDAYPYHGYNMYALDFVFPELLKASPYIVDNPENADYFYFETSLYFGHGQAKDMPAIIKAMKAFGPWFDRKNGADHIWVITDDFGGCAYQWHLPKKSIVIHHFGRVYDALAILPCKVLDWWPDQCDTEIRLVEMEEKRPPCHIPYQHIVVPPNGLYEKTPEHYRHHHHGPQPHVDPVYGPYNATKYTHRPTLFFFAGPINEHKDQPESRDNPWSDAYYSMGVRQTTYRLYKDQPGFKFIQRHIHNYTAEIMASKFCLGPAGWGWGGRVKAAVLHGCIPVIIQPDVKVEWEEQMPLKDYAVRVPFYMVHKLPEILDILVRTNRTHDMLRAMQCAWRFHFWQQPAGRAFDMLMCELKARLYRSPLQEQLAQDPKNEELKAKVAATQVRLNTTTCTLWCGDDIPIDVWNSQPFMV